MKEDAKPKPDPPSTDVEPPAGDAPAPEQHLVFCGSTKWDLIGRKTVPKAVERRGGSDAGEHLFAPTRLNFTALPSRSFSAVFSGPAAAHLVLLDTAGVAYGLGRNDVAQLARRDLLSRRHPVRISPAALAPDERVVHAACGRSHTLLVTSAGRVFSVGNNSYGQLGNGARTELRNPEVSNWQLVQIPAAERAKFATAGGDFSLVACESGALYSMGSGQYGQLGNGRTGECIETGKGIVFDVVKKPVRIAGFGSAENEVRVVQIASGVSHTLALDENGKVWSWGFGGYGRLGHKIPDDELRPRLLETFAAPVYRLDTIACGQTASFAAQKSRKCCYMWGVTKRSAESGMYPKPQFDLQGWEVRSMASGNTSTVVAAERSVISWGCSPAFGELGYGDDQPKSSTKPQVMPALEGLVVTQVTEGQAFTAMLANVENDDDRKIFDALPVLDIEGEGDEEATESGDKRKSSGKANGQSKGKSKKRRRK